MAEFQHTAEVYKFRNRISGGDSSYVNEIIVHIHEYLTERLMEHNLRTPTDWVLKIIKKPNNFGVSQGSDVRVNICFRKEEDLVFFHLKGFIDDNLLY